MGSIRQARGAKGSGSFSPSRTNAGRDFIAAHALSLGRGWFAKGSKGVAGRAGSFFLRPCSWSRNVDVATSAIQILTLASSPPRRYPPHHLSLTRFSLSGNPRPVSSSIFIQSPPFPSLGRPLGRRSTASGAEIEPRLRGAREQGLCSRLIFQPVHWLP